MPHVLLHALHLVHEPAQFTGHGSVLHACDWGAGHALPPCAVAVEVLYVRVCVPPPHVLLHVLHWFHAPAQSTGHGAVLHACDSAAGQALPPCAADVVTLYDRVCDPPPHSLLHVLHAAHEPAQFTGHACVLQA